MYYAGDGSDDSSVSWTSVVKPAVSEAAKRFSGGRGRPAPDLWPCPLPRRGRSLSVSCGSALLIPPPCSEHSAPSGRLSARLQHQVELNWYLLASEVAAGTWASAWTCTDGLARRGGRSSPPANLFVLYCTHQAPVSHHPFSSIAMEKPCRCMYLTSVQMHLFEKGNESLTYLE